VLADGRGRMPGFGSRLTPDQLRVLADYFSARR